MDEVNVNNLHKIAFFNVTLYINSDSRLMNEPHVVTKFEDQFSVLSIKNPVNTNKDYFDLAGTFTIGFIEDHQKELMNAWDNSNYSWIDDPLW